MATTCASLSDLAVSTYINHAHPTLASRAEFRFVGPTNSHHFNLPHNMHQDGEWKFSVDHIGTAIRTGSGLSGKPRTKPI